MDESYAGVIWTAIVGARYCRGGGNKTPITILFSGPESLRRTVDRHTVRLRLLPYLHDEYECDSGRM